MGTEFDTLHLINGFEIFDSRAPYQCIIIAPLGMMKTVIGIVGTRGIPNRYGGFEELAEVLSIGLVERGFKVFVYNPHDHVNQNSIWRGVNIIHKHSPEYLFGLGAIIYDLNSFRDSLKRNFDVIIQLGYGTSSVWSLMVPESTKIITNMDGLEWKRAKYGFVARNFLKISERIAIKRSDHLIADSPVIKKYLSRYKKNVSTIAYGARLFNAPDPSILGKYEVKPYNYHILIARMVPENNIEMILEGYLASDSEVPFLVIGNQQNRYGRYIARKFNHERINFLGPLFDKATLNNLRHYSNIYFHGHMVGGTNPSLLEAMASSSFICAHNNAFNREVLGENAIFFSSVDDVSNVIRTEFKDPDSSQIYRNKNEIKNNYVWSDIIDQYTKVLGDLCNIPLDTHENKVIT